MKANRTVNVNSMREDLSLPLMRSNAVAAVVASAPAFPKQIAVPPSRGVAPLRRTDLAFIFGSARSGTTWLAKLLDSSRDVLYVHEPCSKGKGLVLHEAIATLASGLEISVALRERALAELVMNSAQFSHPPFFAKNFGVGAQSTSIRWLLARVATLKSLTVHSRTAAAAVRMIVVKDGLAPYSLPLAKAIDAKCIVLLRHPCAVVSSLIRGQRLGTMAPICRETFWAADCVALDSLGYSKAQLMQLTEDECLALMWLVTNRRIPALSTLPWIRVVNYSTLVREPLMELKRICSWLGLDVATQMVDFLDASTRPRYDWFRGLWGPKKLYFSVARRCLDPDTIWKQEMTHASVERVLKIVSQFPVKQYWAD